MQLIITATLAIVVEVFAAVFFYEWAKANELLKQPQSVLVTIAILSSLFVVCQLAVVGHLTKKLLSYIAWIEEENALYASNEFDESRSLKNQLRRVLGFAQLLYRRHHNELNTEGKEFLNYIYINAKVMSKGLQPKSDWGGTGHHSDLLRKGHFTRMRPTTKALSQSHWSYTPDK